MKLPNVRDLSVATAQVATKSAMNPVLWVCALTSPICFIAAAETTGPMRYLFFIAGFGPVCYAIRAYEHFMKKDPDRLQSERYLIERQMVARIGVNDDEIEAEIVIEPSSPSTNNPLLEGDRDA